MTDRGIDYSGPGATCNRDAATGIRYGIVPIGALHEWAWDSVESHYTPRCPECGEELAEDEHDALDHHSDSPCPHCQKTIERDDCYGDEPDSQTIDSDGVKGQVDSDGDVWVFVSPYYTRAQFCSPCAPGAVYLTNPCDDGERGYCLGHDWYEGGTAPYPIFKVSDDSQVTGGEACTGDS